MGASAVAPEIAGGSADWVEALEIEGYGVVEGSVIVETYAHNFPIIGAGVCIWVAGDGDVVGPTGAYGFSFSIFLDHFCIRLAEQFQDLVLSHSFGYVLICVQKGSFAFGRGSVGKRCYRGEEFGLWRGGVGVGDFGGA